MRLLAGAAALLALGAGLGTYFAMGGPGIKRPPADERNAVLEAALSRGLIRGYHVIPSGYEVVGDRIQFTTAPPACGGDHPGPACIQTGPLMFIEYRHAAATQAEAILRISRARMPNAKIKFFEIAALGG